MSYKKAALLYGIAFFIQFSILNLFSIHGVTPNLLLCMMIFIAYRYQDGFRPALIAIPFALLADVVGGHYVGVGALALFLLCIVIFYFGRDLNRENVWTLLAVSAIGTALYYLIYWLIMSLLGTPGTVFGLLQFLFVALIVNLLTILASYFVYLRIYRRRIRPTGYAMVDRRLTTNNRNRKKNIRNFR